jgi:hypothetical protein
MYGVIGCLFIALLIEGSCRLMLFRFFNEDIPKSNCSIAWRISWLGRHLGQKNKSNRLARFILPAVYDRSKGWSLRPGLKNFIWVGKFSTNRNGLRGVKEYTYDKVFHRKRIIIIGDSYVMGAENNDNEIFPFLLGEMLPNYDVLNFGVGGYGHDQMLLKLKEEGVRYNPDIVILLYLSCDNSRNLLTFRDYAKPRYVLKNNKLLLTNVPISPPGEIIRKDYLHSYFLDLISFITYRIKFETGSMYIEETQITKAIIKEMKRVCSQMKAEFIIVVFANDIDNGRINPTKIDDEFISSIILDTHDYPQSYFEGHWNPAGHRIVAEKVMEGFRKFRLIE